MENFANYLLENDLLPDADDLISEKVVIKVDSKGNKTKRKKAPKGFKVGSTGKLERMSASEKMSRSKGSKRGAKKKRGKQTEINRKTAKAKKRRKSLVH